MHNNFRHKVSRHLVDDFHVGIDQIADRLDLSLELWVYRTDVVLLQNKTKNNLKKYIRFQIGEIRFADNFFFAVDVRKSCVCSTS